MAAWKEKFTELPEENGRQTELWITGNAGHEQLRASVEAPAGFTRQYESAGEPDRDTEMP